MLEFEDQPCCPVSRDWASNPSVETSDNTEAPEDKRKCEDPESPVAKKMRLVGLLSGTAHRQSFGSQEKGPNPPNVSGSNLTAEELASVTGMSPSGAQVVDVYRTGAKCVPGSWRLKGSLVLRITRWELLSEARPGDRTCSMSCATSWHGGTSSDARGTADALPRRTPSTCQLWSLEGAPIARRPCGKH